MLFSYRVKSAEGQITEGTAEAADRFSLARDFRAKGCLPIYIAEAKKNTVKLNKFFRLFGKVNVQEQILFTKNLAGMLKAGLALARSISVLKKQTKNAKFGNILTALENEISTGGTLSSGLAKFPNVFSKLFVSMVHAGEESGNLAGVLSEIGANLEKSHALTKKVKGALIYPGIVLSAMVLIGVLMFAFVVPTLAKTFKDVGAELPASTQFIVFLGNFFSHYLLLSLFLVVALAGGTVFLFKASWMAKYIDFIVLRLPAIGKMTKELNTARTARTISSLLVSGVSIIRSIEITQDVVQNIYYKQALEQAKESIQKGLPFSQIFINNPKLYPIMMVEMVQVGEETGRLSDMLLQIAVFYEEEIQNKTKNLSTIIEPVLMVVIGAAVGFFAMSMITPLYSVMNNIK
jgi:type IV pilus assembly protein PilC